MERGELSQTLAVEAPSTGLNFYRSHRRVVLFLFLAPFFYEVWWYWQLFAFTRREDFPRARRVWWLLVPIYGLVVLYRQFDDVKGAAIRAGVRALSSVLAIWLVIFSWWAGGVSSRIGNDYGSLAAFLLSGVLIATVGASVQPTANAVLKNKYPDASLVGMTWGELTAAVLGLALFGLVVTATFTSAFSTASSPTTVPSRAATTHMVSRLRPIAVRTGDGIQLASTHVGCFVSRDQGVVWLDCVPFSRGLHPVAGSSGVSISSRAAILSRVDSSGNSSPIVQRQEPSRAVLILVPIPRRKPQSGAAPVGAVLPVGGSPVICDIERNAGVPTLFCGLASKVTGPDNALNVGYLGSSYGVTISRTGAAVIRWNRDGTYAFVRRRSEPAG